MFAPLLVKQFCPPLVCRSGTLKSSQCLWRKTLGLVREFLASRSYMQPGSSLFSDLKTADLMRSDIERSSRRSSTGSTGASYLALEIIRILLFHNFLPSIKGDLICTSPHKEIISEMWVSMACYLNLESSKVIDTITFYRSRNP